MTVNDIINNKFIGIVKVDIEAPKNLHVPILPERKDGKLIFDLENKVEKEYTSVELKYAINHGYKITKIYSALEFKRYTGFMNKKTLSFSLK